MKESFIIEGKKYISSKRASAISDYAPDYIGQLCRANKLDCKMIGRSWFVTEESIYLHKANISREEASRNRIENLKGSSVIDSKIESNNQISVENSHSADAGVVSSKVIVTNNSEKVGNDKQKLLQQKTISGIVSPYTYSSDDRPLLPILKKNIATVDLETKKIVVNQKSNNSPIITNPVIINNKQKEIPVSKKESVKIGEIKKNPKSSFKKYSYPEIARSIILKRVIAPTLVILMFFGLGTTTYIVADRVNQSVTPKLAKPIMAASVSISDSFDLFFSMIKDGYSGVVAFFTSPAKLAINIPKEFGDVSVSEITPNGIVLSSSTGSDSNDEILKSKIAKSFSDEVEVNPDKSGTAGVITPVFKDTKGKDFVYVMVPVKERVSDSNNQ